MLPYQEGATKLEELLEKLFEDDDKSAPEDVVVLKKPDPPKPFGSCCSYNYGGYS